MWAMILALLLAVQAQSIVDIRDLSPQEYRSTAFVLNAPQELQITAVGAEPWPERYSNRDDDWQNDEQTTWPAAGWILDAKTRAVVWDLRAVETQRTANGLRHFSGKLRLPAGVYEAHFAFYPSANINFSGFN